MIFILKAIALSLFFFAAGVTFQSWMRKHRPMKIPKALPAPEDVASPPDDAVQESSGLSSKVLLKGLGTVHALSDDTVTVHYTGWETSGKMFDSSVLREIPATFNLEQVIAGWREGVMLMVEGEKRRIWIPSEMAYANMPDMPQGMLVFDVELLKIHKS